MFNVFLFSAFLSVWWQAQYNCPLPRVAGRSGFNPVSITETSCRHNFYYPCNSAWEILVCSQSWLLQQSGPGKRHLSHSSLLFLANNLLPPFLFTVLDHLLCFLSCVITHDWPPAVCWFQSMRNSSITRCLGMSAFVLPDRSESSVETCKTYSALANIWPFRCSLTMFLLNVTLQQK